MTEHNVALQAFLAQMQASIKKLEAEVKELQDWKDKQPLYTQLDGKWTIVPNCFD